MKKLFLYLILLPVLAQSQSSIQFFPRTALVNSSIVYNVTNYSISGNGVTDNTSALSTLLNSTAPSGSTIYFPVTATGGTYNVAGTVTVTNKYFNFISDFATIHVTGNVPAFLFSSTSNTALAGSKNNFNELIFTGTSTGTNQAGVFFGQDASKFNVNNCRFYNFGGAGIRAFIINAQAGAGGIITDCFFDNDAIGVDLQLAAEYVNIECNHFNACLQAIQGQAGNCRIIGNDINRGGAGIKWIAGSNDGHGIIDGNNLNHMTTPGTGNGMDLSGLTNGYTICNNHSYSCNWSIATCTGVTVSGGELDVSTYTFNTNTGLVFENVTFVGTLGNQTITGTPPIYKNCINLNGEIATSPNSFLTGVTRVPSFALNSSTSLQTFAATSNYYISPLYSTVGSRSVVNQITFSTGMNCRLIGYNITTVQNSASPDQLNSTVRFRLNNSGILTLNSAVLWNATAWTSNSYSAMNLNQSILAADKWEVELVTPAFVVPPVNAVLAVTLYFSTDY